jgi:branched-chain amino acid transport system substrate-binding protein
MAIRWQDEPWARDLWYRGKIARRRFLGLGAAGAGALGAAVLVPAPWREAFGQAKPYRIGALQPLTGPAAAGGRMALVGSELAVQRINRTGGVSGRPIELIVEDYQSKPDAGRRKAEKLATEDRIDAHQGGFLSNVCLACMPVWEEHQIVNMIGVCLDTTITTTKCSRYSFRPFDYAPAQAVAFAPTLVGMAKRWHLVYADYAWGQSTRDAYTAEIRKLGGQVVGATGIPLGTADMAPFLAKITGGFDGLFGIFFGRDGVTVGTQVYDLGLSRKYRWAGDGAIAEATNLPALGAKIEGFVGINRYVPVFESSLDTPFHRRWFQDVLAATRKFDASGVAPDRYTQSNFEAMNFLKLGMQKSGFRGREDSTKLIEALEGMEVRAGDDFPQGDKKLRKEDHQAFIDQFVFEIRNGKHRIATRIPWPKTVLPPACSFA